MSTDQPALGLALRNLGAAQVERIAQLAEQAGFTHLHFPENGHAGTGEIVGRDPFLLASAALRATTALRAGPGVAATVIRPYYSMAITAATIQENSAGRFVLGCGVSHAAAVQQYGESYPRSPLAHAREFLENLRAIRGRFSYGADFPVYLSALGPKMLELAATDADGVMLNWMSVAEAKSATGQFRQAAPPAAHTVLYLRTGTPEALGAEAQQYARFDNYRRHFDRQGLGTLEQVVAGTCLPADRAGLLDAVSAYRAAGVDVPTIYPVAMSEQEICRLIEKFGAA
jgi:alkanesulfonate monooxygenase SsuD/methylene tetrahydromethanopterin reductase-like flavin-dependent oxidoreductase (luciferase family)